MCCTGVWGVKALALDLVSVKEKLAAKGGFTLTPRARMLDDLKALLLDLTAQRAAPGACPVNVAFSGASPASVGDYDTAADGVRALTCSCQSVQEGCGCNSVGCVCENENTGCVCESESVRSCACDSYGECPSVSACTAHSDNICSGVSQSGCSGLADNCTCDADASSVCPSYAAGCACDAFTAACSCDAVVSSCPCNAYYGT